MADTTATTPEAVTTRNQIADHLDTIADIVATSGVTAEDLGFGEGATLDDIRAETARYRETGIL